MQEKKIMQTEQDTQVLCIQSMEDNLEDLVEELQDLEVLDGEVLDQPLEASEDEQEQSLREEYSLDGSPDIIEKQLDLTNEDQEDATIEDQEVTSIEIENVENQTEPQQEVAIIDGIVEPTDEVEQAVNPIQVELAENLAEVKDLENQSEAPQEVAPIEVELAENPTEVKELEKPTEKKAKEVFKLVNQSNLDGVLSQIAVKRGRKLYYKPNEIIYSHEAIVTFKKNNEEGVDIKKILDAKIKEGVKLGCLDKFDGLSTSEIKEEYLNDTLYEFAGQEFKRCGLLYDGKKIKVYVYEWTGNSCHHIGEIDEKQCEELIDYITNRENYSFDISAIITGGKFKKVTTDEKTGKIKIEKGDDGKLGVELDISVMNRKD